MLSKVEITKKNTSRYRVLVDSAEQEGQHDSQHEAIQHALNAQLENPDAKVSIMKNETIDIGWTPPAYDSLEGSTPIELDQRTDNSAILNDWASNASIEGDVLYVRPGRYYFSEPVNLNRLTSNGKTLAIIGHGATFWTDQDISILQRTAQSHSEAKNKINTRIFLEGLFLENEGDSTRSGIELGPSYLSRLQDVTVKGFARSFHLRFALGAKLSNCHSNHATDAGFVVDIANWTGGNANNAQSNGTVLDGCRVFGGSGVQDHYRVLGCSGVAIRDSIGEGRPPVNAHVKVDMLNSTTMRDFTLDTFHAESNGLANHIQLAMQGTALLRNVWAQYDPSGYVIDTIPESTVHNNVGYGLAVKVSSWPYWGAFEGAYFRTDQHAHYFEFSGNANQLDPTQTGLWHGRSSEPNSPPRYCVQSRDKQESRV